MEFKSITIKNFRNFEDVDISLSNKNIFFGMNDVGKTNFLYAMRFVFDKDVRKRDLIESDYNNKNTTVPIEITVKLDIQDTDCIDNQKLRAKLKGALTSKEQEVYIKLKADFDNQEMIGIPILYWGGNPEKLQKMKTRGYLFELDYVFNVFYIDAYVDLYALFRKNIKTLINNDASTDSEVLDQIQDTVDKLNCHISELSGIRRFEDTITTEYSKYRDENISIAVKSEVAVKGLYSNIIPYIRENEGANLYPTSGEGRKKLLTYTLYDLISKDSAEEKINMFLIEEPENHLHKSMQIALSQIIFADNSYKYLFATTHSPFVLYEMDEVNLVRVYNENKINSASVFYSVPEKYRDNKKLLNRNLAEAIFADKVLLVEGLSEVVLFEKVLSCINPFFEANGVYILSVNGIGFRNYFEILDSLNIVNFIRTDNDLRKNSDDGKYSVLGFSRCNSYISEDNCYLPTERILSNTVDARRKLYEDNLELIQEISSKYNIFLARCDLENDLDEFFHEKLVRYLNTKEPVQYLQRSKQFNMVELTQLLTKTDCETIYNNSNFACLKEILL